MPDIRVLTGDDDPSHQRAIRTALAGRSAITVIDALEMVALPDGARAATDAGFTVATHPNRCAPR